MSNPQKICPECGKAATITAATCANCAHAFSTKFPVAERTPAKAPAASAPFVPSPARPRPSGISILLMVIGAGTLGIIALVALITVVGSLVSPSRSASAPSGAVVSDAQINQIYQMMPELLMLSVVKHVGDTPIPDNGSHLWEFSTEDGGTLLVRCDVIYNEADQRDEFFVGYVKRFPANQSDASQ